MPDVLFATRAPVPAAPGSRSLVRHTSRLASGGICFRPGLFPGVSGSRCRRAEHALARAPGRFAPERGTGYGRAAPQHERSVPGCTFVSRRAPSERCRSTSRARCQVASAAPCLLARGAGRGVLRIRRRALALASFGQSLRMRYSAASTGVAHSDANSRVAWQTSP